MIAGLEEITHGTISIGDRDVTELPPPERDIAMVFQNYALYPHMSVRQNLGFGLSVRHTPKAEIERRVADAADAARPRGSARPQAGSPLRRTAATRRDGSRNHSRTGCVPDGRAALEPRCQAPRWDAGVACAATRTSFRDEHLCHPRPDRGNDTRPTRRRHARRTRRPGRRATAPLPLAERPLRRGVHRIAVDEPRRGDRRGRRNRVRTVPNTARAREAASPGRQQRSSSESGPRRSTTPRSARPSCHASRWQSTSSRSSARTRTCSSMWRRSTCHDRDARRYERRRDDPGGERRAVHSPRRPCDEGPAWRVARARRRPDEVPLLRRRDGREPATCRSRPSGRARRSAARRGRAGHGGIEMSAPASTSGSFVA